MCNGALSYTSRQTSNIPSNQRFCKPLVFLFFKLRKNFPIEIKPPFYTKNLRIDENKLVALFLLKTRDEKEKTHNEIQMGQFVGEEKYTSFIPERLRLSKESQPIRSEWCVMSYSGH